MRAYTHIAFGIVISLIITSHLSLLDPARLLIIALTLFGSVFPDIDHPKSLLGRRIKWIAPVLFEHRGIMHSLWPVILIGSVTILFHAPLFFISSFLLGYVSHLLLDSMTHAGIRPLFPFTFQIKGFCKTGGIIDHVLLLTCICGAIAVAIF